MMKHLLRIFLLVVIFVSSASAQGERDSTEMLKELFDSMKDDSPEGKGESGVSEEKLKKFMESLGDGLNPELLEELKGKAQRRLNQNGRLYERSDHQREDDDVMDSFDSILPEVQKSIVRIFSDGDLVSLGTVVSEDGYVLTKASELTDMVVSAEFGNGDRVSGRVCDRFKIYDLALIKLEAEALHPAKFVSLDELAAGSFLIAPGMDPEPLAIGALSVIPRNLSHKGKGFLGIGITPANGGGVTVTGVLEGGAARAGIRRGDVIMSIDEQPVHSVQQLIKLISGRSPQDTVILKYTRNGKDMEVEADLGERRRDKRRELMDQFDYTNKMGGEISEHRAGYPKAIQHDLVLSPQECGGPLVDLLGNIVGVNIARAGRTRSYAIPASELTKILTPVAPGVQLFAKPRKVLEVDLKDTEKALERAKADLKAAEIRKQALEKMLKGVEQKN